MKKFLLVSNYVPKPHFKYPGGFTCPLEHRKASHQKKIELFERILKEEVLWDVLEMENEAEYLEVKINSSEYDLILISGSPYDTRDDEVWIHKLRKTLAAYVKNPTTPLVGICFGVQLLAEVLGGKVERMPKLLEKDIELKDIEKNLLGYSSTFHHDKISVLPKGESTIAFGPENIPYVINFSDKLFGIQPHPANLLVDTSKQAMADLFWKEYFERILGVKV